MTETAIKNKKRSNFCTIYTFHTLDTLTFNSTGNKRRDFETILRIIFKIKKDNHEVSEALHSEGIYSWENFIDVASIFISDLTKALNGNRVPVLYQTKILKY